MVTSKATTPFSGHVMVHGVLLVGVGGVVVGDVTEAAIVVLSVLKKVISVGIKTCYIMYRIWAE